MKKAWILALEGDKFAIQIANFKPKKAILETPKDKFGNYITTMDRIDLYKADPETKKKIVNYSNPTVFEWRADIKQVAEPAPSKEPTATTIVAPSPTKTAPKLPSAEQFIEAYLEKEDGNPRALKTLIRNYVLAKRGK